MARCSGLQRRGAIYYWRKRVPQQRGGTRRPTHVAISLGTPIPARARLLAAELNFVAEKLSEHLAMMTTEQIKGVFRQVLLAQTAKCDAVIADESGEPGFDPRESIQEDLRRHWTYRWLAMRGPNTDVDDEVANQMRGAGVSEEDIYIVAIRLQQLRHHRMVPVPQGKLEKLMANVGADPTEGNIRLAQQTYFRAMSEAAALSARAQSEGRVADKAEAEAVLLAAAKELPQPYQQAPAQCAKSAQVATHPSGAATSEVAASSQAAAAPSGVPTTGVSSVKDDIVTLGEGLIDNQARDENWDTKLQDQNRQTFALFARFLSEEKNIRGLAALRQEYLADFVKFLRQEVYCHYGKSPKDSDLSIEQLREKAKMKAKEAKDPSLIGIKGTTINRHLTALGQLFAHASAQGVEMPEKLQLAELRPKNNKKKKRKRDERLKLPLPVSLRVYHAVPYVGCAEWDRPHETGPFVYHRALYYVPMLLEYGGFRRDEVSGLCVDDVINGPIPFLHIRRNEFRRIKNPQSDRKIPIHPELVRLGFLEYVARIRSLGYRRVFPDLHSPTSKSPLGDRLYDEFRPILSCACEAENESLDHDLHSIRHAFDTRLKAKKVSEEARADLMGHAGASETSERYAEAINLENALEVLGKLPIVTAHLQPQPTRLLPWIERCEIAPFSRAAKKQRRV